MITVCYHNSQGVVMTVCYHSSQGVVASHASKQAFIALNATLAQFLASYSKSSGIVSSVQGQFLALYHACTYHSYNGIIMYAIGICWAMDDKKCVSV